MSFTTTASIAIRAVAGRHYNGLYIYDNVLADGSTDLPGEPYGDDMTAQIFLEGSGDGTPCQDSTSNVLIFNNVLTASAVSTAGLHASTRRTTSTTTR